MQVTSDAVMATRAPHLRASSQAIAIVLIVSGNSNKYPSTINILVLDIKLAKHGSYFTLEDMPWFHPKEQFMSNSRNYLTFIERQSRKDIRMRIDNPLVWTIKSIMDSVTNIIYMLMVMLTQ